MFKRLLTISIILLFLSACSAAASAEPQVLRLATTTSTDNSGLLDAILPTFEETYGARVDVIAVGTGEAITLGEAGDVDIILVHAPAREDAFVAAGHGTTRFDVMYNDFIIVGPADDPAGIRGMPLAADALAIIASSGSTFASRGDDSGTHTKEQSLWNAAGLEANPTADWYKSLGQGMGDTLRFAAETRAYTITDRGTFLALQNNLDGLEVMVGGHSIVENQDPSLYNAYGVIPVNPNKNENINNELAKQLATWLTSLETQTMISTFGQDKFGQPLFYPNSAAWNNR